MNELKFSFCLFLILIINLSFGSIASSLVITEVTKECQTDSDCDGESSFCNLLNKTCSCRPNSPEYKEQNTSLILVDQRIMCITAKNIGEGCRFDQECRLSDLHSVCSNHFCRCEHQKDETTGVCSPIRDTTSTEKEVNKAMLPVMIVMGLMFVGMCVALNMFSRARFSNTSRGVFNAHPGVLKGGGGGSQHRSHRRLSPKSSVNAHLEIPQGDMTPEPPAGSFQNPATEFRPHLDPNQNV